MGPVQEKFLKAFIHHKKDATGITPLQDLLQQSPVCCLSSGVAGLTEK